MVAYVHKKQCHPRVVWVNLRDDVTVHCDLLTYSVRDVAALDEPVLLPAATRRDVEVLDSLPVTSRDLESRPTPISSELSELRTGEPRVATRRTTQFAVAACVRPITVLSVHVK